MIVRTKTPRNLWSALAGVLHVLLIVPVIVPVPVAEAREKPPLARAQPTQGTAFILATTGIDYTRPGVAVRLARDGEGEAIAWDAVDGDRLPFGADDEQSRLVVLAPAYVIPVRVLPELGVSSDAAMTFARRTPARVIVVPWRLVEAPSSREFVAALAAAKEFLVIVAAGDGDGRFTHTHAGYAGLDHVVTVGALTPGDAVGERSRKGTADVTLVPPAASREAPGMATATPRNSSEAAILLVGQLLCYKAKLAEAKSPAEAKKILLALAQIDGQTGVPLLEDCTRGGVRMR